MEKSATYHARKQAALGQAEEQAETDKLREIMHEPNAHASQAPQGRHEPDPYPWGDLLQDQITRYLPLCSHIISVYQNTC
jgi:hypothetical protein